jgi:ABC-type nitrate/sulfonate/bicarbonate transport system permease component
LRKRSENITRNLPAAITLILIVILWEAVSRSGAVPAYMLPAPTAVVNAMISDFPVLMHHAATTLQEAAWGLGIEILLAMAMATVMDRFLVLNRAFYPLMIISQTIPTIAIAPLLVLWMGFGMSPKITLVVLTTFSRLRSGFWMGIAAWMRMPLT